MSKTDVIVVHYVCEPPKDKSKEVTMYIEDVAKGIRVDKKKGDEDTKTYLYLSLDSDHIINKYTGGGRTTFKLSIPELLNVLDVVNCMVGAEDNNEKG